MSDQRYPWDPYSDQPHVISNKKFKRSLYFRGAVSSIKTLCYLPFLPFIALKMAFAKRYQIGQKITLFGLGVNLAEVMKGQSHLSAEELKSLVLELGIEDLMVRVPLSDISNLEKYKEFISCFPLHRVAVAILQDRRNIEDVVLRRKNFYRVFSELGSVVKRFQVGNSINRKKWGFVSTDEYFSFFYDAQKIRNQSFQDLELLGGNIIDFELPNYARSVFHLAKARYDGVAAQLYVDRRGAPENTQLGADLVTKVHWFFEMASLSRKTSRRLHITEVNWPLVGTEPYAPAVGDCMVDEDDQARYLVRYYLLAIASGRVEKCYWHQLVAPGYGLIDNRGAEIRKRKAFYCFKHLISQLEGAVVVDFSDGKSDYYALVAEKDGRYVTVFWSVRERLVVSVTDIYEVSAISGQRIDVKAEGKTKEAKLNIGADPVFVSSKAILDPKII